MRRVKFTLEFCNARLELLACLLELLDVRGTFAFETQAELLCFGVGARDLPLEFGARGRLVFERLAQLLEIALSVAQIVLRFATCSRLLFDGSTRLFDLRLKLLLQL